MRNNPIHNYEKLVDRRGTQNGQKSRKKMPKLAIRDIQLRKMSNSLLIPNAGKAVGQINTLLD